jgi:hypothetical protein
MLPFKLTSPSIFHPLPLPLLFVITTAMIDELKLDGGGEFIVGLATSFGGFEDVD